MNNEPTRENGFHAEHARLLLGSFHRWTGRHLVANDGCHQGQARRLWLAPFVVVSHNTDRDPTFNYGNQTALDLFEMDWQSFTKLPSRQSAEPMDRAERSRLLAEVTENGFVDDYAGVRISASGRRFQIDQATVWNLVDARGYYLGQAAYFDRWRFLP